MAYWASQKVVIDLESGTAAVNNPFADQLQFGTAAKTDKWTARSTSPPLGDTSTNRISAEPSESALYSLSHVLALCGGRRRLQESQDRDLLGEGKEWNQSDKIILAPSPP